MAPTAQQWLADYAVALGIAPPSDDELDTILALAGVAAHSSERIAAPAAGWLPPPPRRPARRGTPAGRRDLAGHRFGAQQLAQLDLQLQRRERRGEALVRAGRGDR